MILDGAPWPLGLLEDDARCHVLLEAERRLADFDHEGRQALEDVDGHTRGEALGGEAGEQVGGALEALDDAERARRQVGEGSRRVPAAGARRKSRRIRRAAALLDSSGIV